MPRLSISDAGRRAGLRPSAIRYYEQVGLLLPARRVSGQRVYDEGVLYRLAVIRRAQEAGFSLEEIKGLFFGFRSSTPISTRWRELAQGKISELEARIEQIQTMKELLEKLQACCRCETVDQCGAGILRSGLPSGNDGSLRSAPPRAPAHRSRT